MDGWVDGARPCSTASEPITAHITSRGTDKTQGQTHQHRGSSAPCNTTVKPKSPTGHTPDLLPQASTSTCAGLGHLQHHQKYPSDAPGYPHPSVPAPALLLDDIPACHHRHFSSTEQRGASPAGPGSCTPHGSSPPGTWGPMGVPAWHWDTLRGGPTTSTHHSHQEQRHPQCAAACNGHGQHGGVSTAACEHCSVVDAEHVSQHVYYSM